MNLNPFLQQLLTKVAQLVVIWLAPKLGQTVTDDQAAQVVIAYVVPGVMALWALWQSYKNRQKLTTALASPAPMSEKQVENVIKVGGAASVLTPKHEIPQ